MIITYTIDIDLCDPLPCLNNHRRWNQGGQGGHGPPRFLGIKKITHQ